MSHTPGPWTIGTSLLCNRNGSPVEVTPIYGDSIAVAECPAYIEEDRPLVAANSLLIASAPDLLAALDGLLAHHVVYESRSDTLQDRIEFARSAIRKARGRITQ